MRTHVVHLYESIGNIDDTINNYEHNLFALNPIPIVGIISSNSLDIPSRQTIIKQLKLKPFEILQNHFDLFISKAIQLNVSIQSIEFTEELDFDLQEELDSALESKDYKGVSKILSEIRDEHVDVFSISFIFQRKTYKMTKYAVAEIIGESNEIPMLISQSPLSLIAGFKKFPSFEIF